MPKFFLDSAPGELVLLTGEDGRHIARSLRMRPGEPLTLCDGKGTDFESVVDAVDGDSVTVRVLRSLPCAAEPSLRAALYQSLPKLDKFDSVVQKAVELGVTRIVPVLSMRCVSRPDAKSLRKKLERWNKIAAEAAKQCGRGILPQVAPVLPFAQAVREAREAGGAGIFFYEGGGTPLSKVIHPAHSCCLFIGPEGGFSPGEVQAAQNAGAIPVTLGRRILRTETAPLAALCGVMLLTGNLE